MADENQNNDWVGIAGHYLPNLLGLLGGAAGAKAIGASLTKPILGAALLGPKPFQRNFKKLEGSMESDPNYVYHATNTERANQIAEEGKLKLHKPWEHTDQNIWPDGSTQKRNYFTSTAQDTWQFAPEEGPGVLLRARKDSHPFKTESTGDIYSTKELPAHKLEYMNNEGQWLPLVDKK